VKDYRQALGALFALADWPHPDRLTEAQIVAYVTSNDPANNTVYQRLSQVRTFLRWCRVEGIADNAAADRLAGRDSPLRTYRRTYGKAQSKNPARYLDYDQAYGALVAACQDGTLAGLRDEIAIRLGLAGMRRAEIVGLTLGDLAELPTIRWTGKGRKPRQMTAGRALVDAIGRYLGAYQDKTPESRLIVGFPPGHWGPAGPPVLTWNTGLDVSGLYRTITKRARQAGIGHVAPHDLRRSGAAILHNAKSTDGGHHFDLLDIQRVLGHSDPAVTMKCYLQPMDTAVLDKAAAYLD
jgi:integrase